ncbi:MAG TPA: FmdB family zinc ribbon protein [Bryobacteraceae bacterium]|jgi:putative FmdB family regulatory protein
MPLYEYRCKQCGTSFEYLVLHSSPAARCPECSGQTLEQLISAYAVSSEGSRQANLSAQHRKVAAVRKDRVRGEHRHLHEHFEDGSH